MTPASSSSLTARVSDGPRGSSRTPSRPRLPSPAETAILAATVVAAVVFAVVRPPVADLYAALSREYAARHGVGLGYWFAWYAGTVPGHYSVLASYAAVAVGSAVLGAISTVAVIALCWQLLRPAPHPVAGLTVAAVSALCNLWSGRIAFLLGMVFVLLCLLAVRAHRRAIATVLAVVVPLVTPTCAAFLALGMVGLVLFDRTRRGTALLVAVVTGAVTLAAPAVFGSPGPEGYRPQDILLCLLTLLFLLAADTPRWLRSVVALSVPACLALAVVPNGLGSNFNRFVWFCLPVAVAALVRDRRALAVLGVCLGLVLGATRTVRDLIVASAPMSSTAYYTGLRAELRTRSDLADERVEVVFDGTHTAAYALLGSAQLARGYETQSDHQFAALLNDSGLGATAFRRWLDTNAVGYVALPRRTLSHNPEYQLVSAHTPDYLTPIWHDSDVTLYRVGHPTPIAAAPARIVSAGQASMRVDVPDDAPNPVLLRLRWSRWLEVVGRGRPAQVSPGPGGFTLLRAPRGCSCTLTGRI